MDNVDFYKSKEIKKEKALEIVRRLMIRGVDDAVEIQEHLRRFKIPINVGLRSIYRYKAIIRKRSKKQIEEKYGVSKTVEEMAFEIREMFDEVQRELWTQYHQTTPKKVLCNCGGEGCTKEIIVQLPPTPGDKIRALREIRETAKHYAEKLQDLGLVNRAPTKVQMVDAQGNPIDPHAGLMENKTQLVAEFLAFYKSKYQDPVGSDKQIKQIQGVEKPPVNYTPLTIQPNG